jgi:AraC-like DNA-binding protein
MDELQLLLFEHETATASPSSASDQDSLQITIDYMKQHYMKPLQIGALAQMAGLTPSSFCRAFKQLTDRTPGSYLTELRIDKAKQLMSDPNVKFKQISSVIGFQDELYFSRVFKKREGVSPTIYMKRNEKRIAIVSGLNLQDQLLALGIHPIAAPSFPAFYGTPSGFPVYLIDKLKRTIPINAERTVSSHEVTSLSPDLILKADFIRNENDDSWQLEGNTVFLKDQDNWESYQRDIALQLNKERELEKIVRQVKKAERYGERELASFTRRGRWTIVRLLPGDCRIYGQTGHAFTDLFYRDLKFQPDGGLEYRSYKSHTLASLVELDPDNVLIIWSDPDTVASYKEDPLWQELRAAKENRVYYPNSKQWDPWGPIGRQYMIKELTGYFLSLA